MMFEAQFKEGLGFYRGEFDVGPFHLVADMSGSILEEHLQIAREFKGPGIPVENTSEARAGYIAEDFATMMRNLVRTKPRDVASVLDSTSVVYFLHAHGDNIEGEWNVNYEGEDGTRFRRPMMSHIRNTIFTKGIESAFLLSCNPGDERIPLPIPMIYPIAAVSPGEFSALSTTVLPSDHQIRSPVEVTLDLLIDGLQDLRVEQLNATTSVQDYFSDRLVEHSRQRYEKLKREFRNALGSS